MLLCIQVMAPVLHVVKTCLKKRWEPSVSKKRRITRLRANMTKEEFVAEVTDGLLPPPAYFPENVRLNKTGYESLDKVMERGLRPLSVDAFEVAAN